MSIIEEPFAEEPPINKPTLEELIISLQSRVSQLEKENAEIIAYNEGYKIQIAELEKERAIMRPVLSQWQVKYDACRIEFHNKRQTLKEQFAEMRAQKEQIEAELELKVDEMTVAVSGDK